MKRLFTGLVVLLTCMSIVSCKNMSNQDVGTMSGAVAGGVLGSTIGQGDGKLIAIAAGTLIGAYLGGSIGKSMDQQDRAHVNETLESNNVGQPAYWRNAKTGNTYRVTPTKNVEVGHNKYCREYRTVADIAGKKQQMYGTACRQPDGSWKAVR